jgi:hypothetical protein
MKFVIARRPSPDGSKSNGSRNATMPPFLSVVLEN